jgi:hypothetical protein
MGIIASAAAKTGLFASGILTGVFTSKPTKVMPETFGMLLLRETILRYVLAEEIEIFFIGMCQLVA